MLFEGLSQAPRVTTRILDHAFDHGSGSPGSPDPWFRPLQLCGILQMGNLDLGMLACLDFSGSKVQGLTRSSSTM